MFNMPAADVCCSTTCRVIGDYRQGANGQNFDALSTELATGEGSTRWSGRSSRRHSPAPAEIAASSEFEVDKSIENRLLTAVCRYRGCERG